ncbi:hypothetical protein TNCV_1401291 [Trichonephila clavipes]|nr:hypothetical protein TNCV_1401291 [Trichonephila clavipes]
MTRLSPLLNTFLSSPSTQIEPAMPDEIINFIKNTSSKKAPVVISKPLLPDSITTANRRHVTPQTEKNQRSQVLHHRHHDMGFRTVYQSRYPKIDCHPLSSTERGTWSFGGCCVEAPGSDKRLCFGGCCPGEVPSAKRTRKTTNSAESGFGASELSHNRWGICDESYPSYF